MPASFFMLICVIFSLFFVLRLNQTCEAVSGPGSRFKGKHSLDSDEEDDAEETKSTNKYDILASDDVDGMSCSTFELSLGIDR